MDDGGFDFSNPASGAVFGLEKRNALADECISRYTIEHCAKDGALSVAGYLPIPFAGFAGMAAGIALQKPLYKRMANDLGNIYLATPEELEAISSDVVVPQTTMNGCIDLAGEITSEIMGVVIQDIIWELVVGGFASAMPVVGGLIGTGLDLAIATKMTRRIGLTSCIFYQNQARWAGGSRDATYSAAKNMEGNANDVRHEVDEVRTSFVKRAKSIIAMLMTMPGATVEQARRILTERNIPRDIIDEALGSI